MSRIRSIKPEFWTSEQILECSTNARLLFIGLWNFCDDAGRHPYSAKQAKAEVFPADDFTESTVSKWLQELSENGLIVPYVADGKRYFYVSGWKHQRIDKPQTPKYPEPIQEHSENAPRTLPPDTIGEDTIGEDISVAHATVVNVAIGPIVFDSFWEAYPKREGSNPKEPARKKFLAAVKSGADPDAIIGSARAYANEVRENKQFGTPYVAQAITWLSQQRWKDYAPAPDDPDKPRDDEVLAKHGYQWDETQGKVVKIEAA